MNENTEHPQPSWVARASFQLGLVAVFVLVLAGGYILSLVTNGDRPDLIGPDPEKDRNIRWVENLGLLLTVPATIAGLTLGIIALVNIRQGVGNRKERGLAISRLVTSTLSGLTLLAVYVVIPLVLLWSLPKVESSNRLKILGLAMHEYHDAYGHFPPAVLHDPELGNRAQPYSWRVALLPFLGQRNLFEQYRRDEPWDSPANQAVLARMPGVFATPGSVRAAGGYTHYQVLVGPGAAFERPDFRARLWDFHRGHDQTILVVEAAHSVPWTKPDDLPYTPDGPLPKVGGLVGNGFHALFADGSVRWIEAGEQESELRTLVPRGGR
jgi:hypothetical protein